MMNITQQKELTATARQALALLDPEWTVTADLKARLELCMVEFPETPKAKTVRKSSKIKKYQPYKPFSAEERAVKHIVPKGKMVPALKSEPEGRQIFAPAVDQVTTCLCAGCRIVRGFFDRGMAPVKMMRPERALETPEAIRNRLTLCACGHSSAAHLEDELNNLLKCSDCDCDHFHYSEDQKAAA